MKTTHLLENALDVVPCIKWGIHIDGSGNLVLYGTDASGTNKNVVLITPQGQLFRCANAGLNGIVVNAQNRAIVETTSL
jgi:hypothetical protein